jgi:transcription initiation factor TFIIIB Brf1 subunit/transcription initiation factor TFIIB
MEVLLSPFYRRRKLRVKKASYIPRLASELGIEKKIRTTSN